MTVTAIFIILRNRTFKCEAPNCLLASINKISEHNWEGWLRLWKANWSFCLASSQCEHHYDMFLEKFLQWKDSHSFHRFPLALSSNVWMYRGNKRCWLVGYVTHQLIIFITCDWHQKFESWKRKSSLAIGAWRWIPQNYYENRSKRIKNEWCSSCRHFCDSLFCIIHFVRVKWLTWHGCFRCHI